MIRQPSKCVKNVNSEAPKYLNTDFEISSELYKNNEQKVVFQNKAISEIIALQALTIKDLRFSVKVNLIISVILGFLFIGNLALRFL